MKIDRQIRILALIPLLWACDAAKNSSEKPVNQEKTNATFIYDIKQLNRKANDCESSACTEVVINYPQFSSAAANSDVINEKINDAIAAILSDYIREVSNGESIEGLISDFLRSYIDFKTNFPESITPWYFKIDVSVSYTSPEFVCLAFNTSSYTGGAHPNSTLQYMNLSKQGKEMNKIKQFFQDVPKLTAQLESNFRTENGLSASENLADKGFMFDKNTFSLSDNFGFNQQGLIVYYNPYEIASHSEGPIVITLPYSDMKDNFKY